MREIIYRPLILITILIASIVMVACERSDEIESTDVIDGTSVDAFNASIASLSSHLQQDMKSKFISSLQRLEREHGTYGHSLSKPSTSFLASVHGMTPQEVIAAAHRLKVEDARSEVIARIQSYRRTNNKLKAQIQEVKDKRAHARAVHEAVRLIELSNADYRLVMPDYFISRDRAKESGAMDAHLSFTATNHSKYAIDIDGFKIIFRQSGGITSETDIPPSCGQFDEEFIMPGGTQRFDCDLHRDMEGIQNMKIKISAATVRNLGGFSMAIPSLLTQTPKELTRKIEKKKSIWHERVNKVIHLCMKIKKNDRKLFERACR